MPRKPKSEAAKKAWAHSDDWKVTEVIADLPLNVDLTKRASLRTLTFKIKSGDEMLGTLHMGRGSVHWYAKNAKKPTGKWSWVQFAGLLSRY